jgi:hypothetical protein
MIAIFYDRKNKRNVTSDELMKINLKQDIAVIDTDDDMVATGRRINPESFEPEYRPNEKDPDYKIWVTWEEEKTPLKIYHREESIAELGYKSEKCQKHCNWDLYTNLNDLVFLYLEEKRL